jgi:aspartyl-tRNA(Asn)/glutamyl-tRNA(Gln) amidotransferase subunit C
MKHEDICKLAALARLELSDEEIVQQGKDMDAILGYIEQLRSVDVAGLAPTSQVTGLMNVLRADDATVRSEAETLDRRAELLATAPDQKDGYVRVPGVFTLRSDGAIGDEFPEEGVL